MMALVLVAAAVLGWYVHQVRVQRVAVQTIIANGGAVEYGYQYDSARNRRLPKGTSWVPPWLQRSLGDDNFFHTITLVGFDQNGANRQVSVSDGDLRALDELRDVRILYLGGGQITDAGLEHLTWFPLASITPTPPAPAKRLPR